MAKVKSQSGVVYYAHAMCMYGHPLERAELDAIRRGLPGHRIINPAEYDDHPEKKREVLNFCLRLIEREAQGVVFSKVLGKITAGVGEEINHALRLGLDVFELTRDEAAGEWVFRRRRRPVEYLSRDETKGLYRRFRLMHS